METPSSVVVEVDFKKIRALRRTKHEPMSPVFQDVSECMRQLREIMREEKFEQLKIIVNKLNDALDAGKRKIENTPSQTKNLFKQLEQKAEQQKLEAVVTVVNILFAEANEYIRQPIILFQALENCFGLIGIISTFSIRMNHDDVLRRMASLCMKQAKTICRQGGDEDWITAEKLLEIASAQFGKRLSPVDFARLLTLQRFVRCAVGKERLPPNVVRFIPLHGMKKTGLPDTLDIS